MAERTYLSIGDVLSLLKGEFPDITISKIRFLESQGLLDPERTPSGYRKFYEEDVDRLRWILRQQRENFLPLKVIKGRLGGNGGNGGNGGTSAHSESERGAGVGAGVTAARSSMGATLRRGEGDLPGSPAEGAPQDPLAEQLAPTAAGRAGSRHQGADDDRTAREPGAREPAARTSTRTSAPSGAPASTARNHLGVPSQARAGRPGTADAPPGEARAPGAPSARSAPPTAPPGGGPEQAARPGGGPEQTARPGGGPEQAVRPGSGPDETARPRGEPESRAGRSGPPAASEEDTGGPLSIGLSGVNLTVEELAGASGLSEDELGELERYGLLVGRPIGDTTYYDEEALAIARLAAGFRRFGIEARHLRMYRTAADREASFFEQIVMPLLKQRNPVARRRAVDTLAELARLGQGLRGALLRSALKDNTGG